MLKKVLAVILVTAIGAAAVGCLPFGGVIGRGPVQTQNFNFSGFTKVEVSFTFDVEIVRDAAFSVSVTTNENVFDRLALEQTGDILKIKLDPGNYTIASLKARVTMPDLTGLTVSGASAAKITGFSSDNLLRLQISGASAAELADIKSGQADFEISGGSRVKGSLICGDLRANLSGASSLELTGSGLDIDVTASGASHVTLQNFICADAKVNFSGASSGTVKAAGRLDVQLSGASSLRYFGSPTLGDINVTGGSSFNKG